MSPKPLKTAKFEYHKPDDSSFGQWKGNIGGQKITIHEDRPPPYETAMLQRWIDGDPEAWGDNSQLIKDHSKTVMWDSIPLEPPSRTVPGVSGLIPIDSIIDL
jgi:hypothetical protein